MDPSIIGIVGIIGLFLLLAMGIYLGPAMLLIGFLAGYVTSNSTCPEYINVIPQQIRVTSPPDSIMLYPSCESVDVVSNADWLKVRINSDSLET